MISQVNPVPDLPPIALGLWAGFGAERPSTEQRAMLWRALECGVRHFELAPAFGPPDGAGEAAMGQMLKREFAAHRDELVLATRLAAGGDLDQSLRRLGTDYVDIVHAEGPLEPAMADGLVAALEAAVQSGKARALGVFSDERSDLFALARVSLAFRQTSYSLLDRRIESEELALLHHRGVRCKAFSPLAAGRLADRRRGEDPMFEPLGRVADARGQTLEQMAIAWTLRDRRIETAVIGATTPDELERRIDARERTDFTDEELTLLAL